MGEGSGNGKAPELGCGKNVFQKNYSWRKGRLHVYDPTFHHLCFSESWIWMFFRPSAFSLVIRRKILGGLRSGTFLQSKGGFLVQCLRPFRATQGMRLQTHALGSSKRQVYKACSDKNMDIVPT